MMITYESLNNEKYNIFNNFTNEVFLMLGCLLAKMFDVFTLSDKRLYKLFANMLLHNKLNVITVLSRISIMCTTHES